LKSRGLITCNDFSKYDGFRTAVVRTETLSSSELEEIVQRANDVWLQHVSKRKPFIQVCNEDSLVSVIIPNFNGKTFLKSCLDSLVGQTKTNNEIILVDNDSEDDSVDFVKRNYPEVHVIALPANKGFSVAVNEGIKHANGTFIAVLNNDTIVAPDWLELLCNCLVKHPDAGFCTSKIVKMDNPDIIDCAGHGITRSGYTFNTRNGVKDSGEYNVQRDVFGASAAAAVYRKSMLDDIGLFDEDFFMYLEDIDLSFRAQLWGYKCMYLPEPAVKHVGFGTTGKQYYKDNIYYIARNTVYLLLKNMPRKLLKKNFLRIMMFFFCLQLYHTLRTYHPLVCSKGILSGLKDCRKMISKRKRILGCMRVTDSYILDKLIDCESKYKRFRKRAFWQ
jgi:hypothetical protein